MRSTLSRVESPDWHHEKMLLQSLPHHSSRCTLKIKIQNDLAAHEFVQRKYKTIWYGEN
jgi:hypothetical protein